MALGVFLAYIAFEISQIQDATYHQMATNERYAAIERKFEKKCNDIVVLDELRYCFQSVIGGDWDTQRAQEDLKAQKDVAKYGLWMFRATVGLGILSLIVGGFGIYFVRETLNATRELSAAENRAWMVFEELKIISDSRSIPPYVSLKISGTIKNIGKSPAFNIRVGAQGSHAVERDALIDDIMGELRNSYRAKPGLFKRTLFPEETPYHFTQTVEFNVRATEALYRRHDIDEPVSNAAMIIFYVLYRIVGDDKPHETMRPYLVGGLPLDKSVSIKCQDLTLKRFDITTGNVT